MNNMPKNVFSYETSTPIVALVFGTSAIDKRHNNLKKEQSIG